MNRVFSVSLRSASDNALFQKNGSSEKIVGRFGFRQFAK
jgi:hypothetical protein